MTLTRSLRAALGAASIAVLGALLALPASAKDVYKPYLDPAIPRHQAILDTLARLELEPTNAGLKNDLGCLVALDGFWRDALREFEEAADLDEKDSRPLFNAGLVRAWRGEWRSARRAFRRAVDRDPGNWPAWWMLGYSQERLGRLRPAIEAYKVSLRTGTSLFDVEVNPFAVSSRLKPAVLLETYEKRLVQAAMPEAQQISDPERIAAFLQPSARPVERAPAAAVVEEPVPASTGPVVTSATPSTSSPTTSAPPAFRGYPPGVRPIPRRPPPPEPEEERPVEQVDPQPVQEEPPSAPGPGGNEKPDDDAQPGPGGFDAPPSPRPTRPPG